MDRPLLQMIMHKWKKDTKATTGKWNIKQSYGHIREKVTDKDIVDVIDQEREHYPVHILCQMLDIPRSTYCQLLTRKSTVNKRNHSYF